MKQILVVSDSHCNHDALMYLYSLYPKAVAYLHLGDSQESASYIYPFITIKGNNDYMISEEYRIVNIEHLKIYMIHGHQMYLNKDNMVAKANRYGCNVFMYGHTHVPFYEFYNGVHILNPGALNRPRSPIGATYALINIDDNNNISFEIKQF